MVLRYFALVVFAIMLTVMAGICGCASKNAGNLETAAPVTTMPELGNPAELGAQLPAQPRSATAAGNEYSEVLPKNRIARQGMLGVFIPDYDVSASPSLDNLAYGIYAFDGTGMSGAQTLSSIWVDAPLAADFWVGLGNQVTQRWEWSYGPLAAPMDIADIAPYIDANDRVLVAAVVTGTESVGLTALCLGGGTPELCLGTASVSYNVQPGGGSSDVICAAGYPAFLLQEDRGDGFSDLSWYRSTQITGSSWPAPDLLYEVSTGNPGLALVGGNPAAAYARPTPDELVYQRAANAEGISWNPAVTVDSANPGAGEKCVIKIVDGNPAIAYTCDGPGPNDDRIMYVRALDAQGATWGAPVILDPNYAVGTQATNCAMEIINGRPAVLYTFVDSSAGTKGVRYAYANDAQGTAWGNPVQVLSLAYTFLGDVRNISLLDLDGVPGAGWYLEDFLLATGEAEIMVGSDAAGTSWYGPSTVAFTEPGVGMLFAGFGAAARADSSIAVVCVATATDGSEHFAMVYSATHAPGAAPDWTTAKSFKITEVGLLGPSSVSGLPPYRRASCYDSGDACNFSFELILLNLLFGIVMPSDASVSAVDEVPVLRVYNLNVGYSFDTSNTVASFNNAYLPLDML